MQSRLYIDEIRVKTDLPQSECYAFSLPAFTGFSGISFKKNVTFIVGENGSGKSTLLEAIAVAAGFNPEGGTKNFCFSSRDTHSNLHNYFTLLRRRYPQDGFFLRSETFYNVASEIDDLGVVNSYGGLSLHRQSHGESFISLICNRFAGRGLYILDEPEAALSPSRQLSLLCRIHELAEQDSQFIISTHSPILMAYPDADIYQLSEEGIKEIPYWETEHYTLMKAFINSPEKFLEELFR